MRPWKRLAANPGTIGPVKLQWGHGDEAVEEKESPAEREARVQLQWGHGDEAVEEWQDRDKPYRDPRASMGPRR